MVIYQSLSTLNVPVGIELHEGPCIVIGRGGQVVQDEIVRRGDGSMLVKKIHVPMEVLRHGRITRDSIGRPCIEVMNVGYLLIDGINVSVAVSMLHGEIELVRLMRHAFNEAAGSAPTTPDYLPELIEFTKQQMRDPNFIRDPIICLQVLNAYRAAKRSKATQVDFTSVFEELMASKDDFETTCLYLIVAQIGVNSDINLKQNASNDYNVVSRGIMDGWRNVGNARRVKAARSGSSIKIKGLADAVGKSATEFGMRYDIDFLGESFQNGIGAVAISYPPQAKALRSAMITRTVVQQSHGLRGSLYFMGGNFGLTNRGLATVSAIRDLLRDTLSAMNNTLSTLSVSRLPLPISVFDARTVNADDKEMRRIMIFAHTILRRNMWTSTARHVAINCCRVVIYSVDESETDTERKSMLNSASTLLKTLGQLNSMSDDEVHGWAANMMLASKLLERSINSLSSVTDKFDTNQTFARRWLENYAKISTRAFVTNKISQIILTTAQWGVMWHQGTADTAELAELLTLAAEHGINGSVVYNMARVLRSGNITASEIDSVNQKNSRMRLQATITADFAAKIARSLTPRPVQLINMCNVVKDMCHVFIDTEKFQEIGFEISEQMVSSRVPSKLVDLVLLQGYEREPTGEDLKGAQQAIEVMENIDASLPVLINEIIEAVPSKSDSSILPFHSGINILKSISSAIRREAETGDAVGIVNAWITISYKLKGEIDRHANTNQLVKKFIKDTVDSLNESIKSRTTIVETACGLFSSGMQKTVAGALPAQILQDSVVNAVFSGFTYFAVQSVSNALFPGSTLMPMILTGSVKCITAAMSVISEPVLSKETPESRPEYAPVDAALAAAAIVSKDIIRSDTWGGARQVVDGIVLYRKDAKNESTKSLTTSVENAIEVCSELSDMALFFPAVAKHIGINCPLCNYTLGGVSVDQFTSFSGQDLFIKSTESSGALRIFFEHAAREKKWNGKSQVFTSADGALARSTWCKVDEDEDMFVFTNDQIDSDSEEVKDMELITINLEGAMATDDLGEVIDLYPEMAKRGKGFQTTTSDWLVVCLRQKTDSTIYRSKVNIKQTSRFKELSKMSRYRMFVDHLKERLVNRAELLRKRITQGGVTPKSRLFQLITAFFTAYAMAQARAFQIDTNSSGAEAFESYFQQSIHQEFGHGGQLSDVTNRVENPKSIGMLQIHGQYHDISQSMLDGTVDSAQPGEDAEGVPQIEHVETEKADGSAEQVRVEDAEGAKSSEGDAGAQVQEAEIVNDPLYGTGDAGGEGAVSVSGSKVGQEEAMMRLHPSVTTDTPVPNKDPGGEANQGEQDGSAKPGTSEDTGDAKPGEAGADARAGVEDTVNDPLYGADDAGGEGAVSVSGSKVGQEEAMMRLHPSVTTDTPVPNKDPGGEANQGEQDGSAKPEASEDAGGAKPSKGDAGARAGGEEAVNDPLYGADNANDASGPKAEGTESSAFDALQAAIGALGAATTALSAKKTSQARNRRKKAKEKSAGTDPSLEKFGGDITSGELDQEDIEFLKNIDIEKQDADTVDEAILKVYSQSEIQINRMFAVRAAHVAAAACAGVAYERPLVIFPDDFETDIDREVTESPVGDFAFISSLRHASDLALLIDEMRIMIDCGRMPVIICDNQKRIDILGAVTEAFIENIDTPAARALRFIVPEAGLLQECRRLWGIPGKKISFLIGIFGKDMISASVTHNIDIYTEDQDYMCNEQTGTRQCFKDSLKALITDWLYPLCTRLKIGIDLPSTEISSELSQAVTDQYNRDKTQISQQIEEEKLARIDAEIDHREFELRVKALTPAEIKSLDDPLRQMRILYEGQMSERGQPGSYERRMILYGTCAGWLMSYVTMFITMVKLYSQGLGALAVAAGPGAGWLFAKILGEGPLAILSLAGAVGQLTAATLAPGALWVKILFGIASTTQALAYHKVLSSKPLYGIARRALRNLPLAPLRWLVTSPTCQNFAIRYLEFSGMALGLYASYLERGPVSDYASIVNRNIVAHAESTNRKNDRTQYFFARVAALCTKKRLMADAKHKGGGTDSSGEEIKGDAYVDTLSAAGKATFREITSLNDAVDATKEAHDNATVDINTERENFATSIKAIKDAFMEYSDQLKQADSAAIENILDKTVTLGEGSDAIDAPHYGVVMSVRDLRSLCDPDYYDAGRELFTTDQPTTFRPHKYQTPFVIDEVDAAGNFVKDIVHSNDTVENKIKMLTKTQFLRFPADGIKGNPHNNLMNSFRTMTKSYRFAHGDKSTWKSATTPIFDQGTTHNNVEIKGVFPGYDGDLKFANTKQDEPPSNEPLVTSPPNEPLRSQGGQDSRAPAVFGNTSFEKITTDRHPIDPSVHRHVHKKIMEAVERSIEELEISHVNSLLLDNPDTFYETVDKSNPRLESVVLQSSFRVLVESASDITIGLIQSIMYIDRGSRGQMKSLTSVLEFDVDHLGKDGRALVSELCYWASYLDSPKFSDHLEHTDNLSALTDKELIAHINEVSSVEFPPDSDVRPDFQRLWSMPRVVLTCMAGRARDQLQGSAYSIGVALAISSYIQHGSARHADHSQVIGALSIYTCLLYCGECLGHEAPVRQSILPASISDDAMYVYNFVSEMSEKFGVVEAVAQLIQDSATWASLFYPMLRRQRDG